MKSKPVLYGSTLAEILIVMVLAGIILTSVFDGFGLFGRLAYRTSTRLEDNMSRLSGLHILDELFSTSDSILGDERHIRFFKGGQYRIGLTIEDSTLMTVAGTEPADSLLRHVSRLEIIRNTDRIGWIDSLVFLTDTVEVRLGLRYGRNISAELASERTEKEIRDENKR